MLRIYFFHRYYQLSQPTAKEALSDSNAIRQFARLKLGRDLIPDGTKNLDLRCLLARHILTIALPEGLGV